MSDDKPKYNIGELPADSNGPAWTCVESDADGPLASFYGQEREANARLFVAAKEHLVDALRFMREGAICAESVGRADNRRFLTDVELWIGQKVELSINEKINTTSAEDVWEKERFMSSRFGAPCTGQLKREAGNQWCNINKPDYMVVGFTADEKARHERFVRNERANVLPVLIDAGLTKADCIQMILDAGIAPPAMYALGYPNANCIGCVKATSPTYWNLVRRTFPDVFARRADQSRHLSCPLVRYKGKRIFLDELPANAKGRALPNHMPDCGIFCEEKF